MSPVPAVHPADPTAPSATLFTSWGQLQRMELGANAWLIDKWLPAGSVVLVWGAESVGKTPLCWYMARAIGRGTPFFNYNTRQARVLFIELDMPPFYTKARTASLEFPEDTVRFFHSSPVADIRDSALQAQFALALAWSPEVVFIDSLRKAHPLDDKVSESPSRVYAAYKRLFPGATLVFIHHERKLGQQDQRPAEESYSGSRAWSNDCQVAFRVSVDARQAFPLLVKNTRHQFMEKDWSERFHLDQGWLLTASSELADIATMAVTLSGAGLVEAIMSKYGCSRATAFRKLAKARA